MVLSGQWTYTASQTAPATAALAGVLTVSPQSCATFQGSLDLTQNLQGTLTPLHGIVSGQALDTSLVQFDAFFAAAGRHHVGAIARDSIKGLWADQTSEPSPPSGSFVAARVMP